MNMTTVGEAISYLMTSMDALMAHHTKTAGDAPLNVELRHANRHPDRVHFQLWWVGIRSAMGSELVWDAFNIIGEPVAEIARFMEEASRIPCLMVSEKAIADEISKPPPDVPLFRYHPQRFRALVPFAKSVAQQAGDTTAFSESMLNAVAQEYIAGQNVKPGLIRPRVEDADERGTFNSAIYLGVYFSEFVRCGRQIFDIPSSLVEMFRNTDVDDIPLDALQFPYECFYLYFGPQTDLETRPGWHPDGAYIQVMGQPRHIQMLLTSAPPDVDTYAQWYSYGEPTYIQSMTPEQTRIGVGEAAEMVLADKIKALQDQVWAQHSILDGAPRLGGLEVVDVSRQKASASLAALPRTYEAWREMLKLIVNAIAYLSAYPDDVEQRWPENTPHSLYLQTQDGGPKQKQRARSKLAALGFTAIHVAGRRLHTDTPNTTDGTRSTTERKPTWVRGHWVRQPHGPRRSLRRLQWRMPHLRNAGSDTDTDAGHLYLVS